MITDKLVKSISRIVAAAALAVGASSAQAATVSAVPSVSSIQSGLSFTVDILGTGFPAVVGGGMEIRWNSALVDLTSVSISTPLPWGGIGTNTGTEAIDMLAPVDETGQLHSLRVGATDFINGVSGDFTIAQLTFDAIAPGVSPLKVFEEPLFNWAAPLTGVPVPATYVNGSITITPTSVVPVPAAVWLFGSGLLGLTGMARRNRA